MPTPGSASRLLLRFLEHFDGSTAGPAEKLKIRVGSRSHEKPQL